jgi:hypothetical protein
MSQYNLLEQSKRLLFRKQYLCRESLFSERLSHSQQNTLLLKYTFRKGDFFNQKPFSGFQDYESFAKFKGAFMRCTLPLIQKLKVLDDLILSQSNFLEINFEAWASIFSNNYHNCHQYIKQRDQEWLAYSQMLDFLDKGLISTDIQKIPENSPLYSH